MILKVLWPHLSLKIKIIYFHSIKLPCFFILKHFGLRFECVNCVVETSITVVRCTGRTGVWRAIDLHKKLLTMLVCFLWKVEIVWCGRNGRQQKIKIIPLFLASVFAELWLCRFSFDGWHYHLIHRYYTCLNPSQSWLQLISGDSSGEQSGGDQHSHQGNGISDAGRYNAILKVLAVLRIRIQHFRSMRIRIKGSDDQKCIKKITANNFFL